MLCVFDDATRLHDPPGYFVFGKLQPSPERPERVDMLLEGVSTVGATLLRPPEICIDAATLVHDPRYLVFLESVFGRWKRQPDASAWAIPNVYAIVRSSLVPAGYPDALVGQVGWHLGDQSAPIMAETIVAARASAASALHAAALVRDGERMVYALCRPPGHHAAADVAAGFCYLNNSALAAESLIRAGLRTAILDVDVHHGNGTQAIFYDRADVLVVSVHRDPSRFYPYFWGYAGEIGQGMGEGYNLNLPLPRGTEDEDYLVALDFAIERVMMHRPDVLVVSAGLDASAEDPFQGFRVTTYGFERIGRRIARMGLPMVVVQEGGYPSPILGANLAALLYGLGA